MNSDNNNENLVSNNSDNAKIIDTSNILATLNVTSNNSTVETSDSSVGDNSIPVNTAVSQNTSVSALDDAASFNTNISTNTDTNINTNSVTTDSSVSNTNSNSILSYMSTGDDSSNAVEGTENVDNSVNNENNSNNEMNTNSISTKIVSFLIILIVIALTVLFVPNLLEGNKKYTVTFMDMEGVYLVEENIPKGKLVTEPKAPTKDGYSFLGWYLDNELYDFNTSIKNDIYLKAKWLNNETNLVEEVEDTKVDKDNSANKNNTSTDNNSKPNGNTNNNSNNNSNDSQTSEPTPTPTPVPTTKPTPVTKTYRVRLNDAKFEDGTTVKDLKAGEKVKIITTLSFMTKETSITGNQSCSTASDVGNTYEIKTQKYSLYWGLGGYDEASGSIVMEGLDEATDRTSFIYTVRAMSVEISASQTPTDTTIQDFECTKYDATSDGETYKCDDGGTLDGTICVKFDSSY